MRFFPYSSEYLVYYVQFSISKYKSMNNKNVDI
jgi:hypothetical protein